uniref:Uncharacterized protein n=1 Tax=Glossina pallidipes TaxID=7398 RepID=A0A1A9ZI61_GLOPL
MYSASLTPPLPPSLTSQHQQEQHHHSVYVQHIRFTLYMEYAISCGHIKSIMLSLGIPTVNLRSDYKYLNGTPKNSVGLKRSQEIHIINGYTRNLEVRVTQVQTARLVAVDVARVEEFEDSSSARVEEFEDSSSARVEEFEDSSSAEQLVHIADFGLNELLVAFLLPADNLEQAVEHIRDFA